MLCLAFLGVLSDALCTRSALKGGQLWVRSPLPLAALAPLAFFTPSLDSSAGKQGSLGLETPWRVAQVEAGQPAGGAGEHSADTIPEGLRHLCGVHRPLPRLTTLNLQALGARCLPTPSDPESTGQRSPECPPHGLKRPPNSAYPSRKIRRVGLLSSLWHVASFPGAASDTAASIFRRRSGRPAAERRHYPWPAGHANAHAQAARDKCKSPTRARVTVTAPVTWGTTVSAAWQSSGHPWQCLCVGRRPPSPPRSLPCPAISGVAQGGTRLRKAAAELRGCPRLSPSIPRMLQARSQAVGCVSPRNLSLLGFSDSCACSSGPALPHLLRNAGLDSTHQNSWHLHHLTQAIILS
ncbi:uncharacterized protein LOC141582706 [Saimiri boliviensis]|uniref:uncharacterized protein LOC141582706 n=1 Tax=Saimiri boliviensis TaxID=27679 RepID=UPI003D77B35F